MIHIFGNCQGHSLARHLPGEATFVNIASPELFRPENFDSAGLERERDILDRLGLADLYPNRSYLPGSPDLGETPGALVFTMFHENAPVFRHKKKGYCIYVPRTVKNAHTEYDRYLEGCFRFVPLEPEKYLRRFRLMVSRARAMFPERPIFVLSRLGHRPGLGPNPRSYLKAWDLLQHQSEDLRTTLKRIPACHWLDQERILAGFLEHQAASRQGLPHADGVDPVFPFLRFRIRPEDPESGRGEAYVPQRDLEHMAPDFAAHLAARLAQCVREGEVRYLGHESIPEAWREADCARASLPDRRIRELLAADDIYSAAEGLAAMFWRGENLTRLLVHARRNIPCFPMLLHMLKVYASLHPDPGLAVFFEAHRERIEPDFGSQNFSNSFMNRYRDQVDLLLKGLRDLARERPDATTPALP